jgi:hypothetical protein
MSFFTKLLKAPLIILVIASFAASIYASANGISGITVSVPIIIGVILLLYTIGAAFEAMANRADSGPM